MDATYGRYDYGVRPKRIFKKIAIVPPLTKEKSIKFSMNKNLENTPNLLEIWEILVKFKRF